MPKTPPSNGDRDTRHQKVNMNDIQKIQLKVDNHWKQRK